jgi:hypothetical protein
MEEKSDTDECLVFVTESSRDGKNWCLITDEIQETGCFTRQGYMIEISLSDSNMRMR